VDRQCLGRDPYSSAALLGVQSVKMVEELSTMSGSAAQEQVQGHKRHLLVDTMGILLSFSVTPSDLHDRHRVGDSWLE